MVVHSMHEYVLVLSRADFLALCGWMGRRKTLCFAVHSHSLELLERYVHMGFLTPFWTVLQGIVVSFPFAYIPLFFPSCFYVHPTFSILLLDVVYFVVFTTALKRGRVADPRVHEVWAPWWQPHNIWCSLVLCRYRKQNHGIYEQCTLNFD